MGLHEWGTQLSVSDAWATRQMVSVGGVWATRRRWGINKIMTCFFEKHSEMADSLASHSCGDR